MLLQKVVYSYEYMNDWENFSETPLPEKNYFYNHLNIIEDIADVDYTQVKRFLRDSEIKTSGQYHHLHF